MISVSQIVRRALENEKPFVAVACLCEKVLREEDGVLSAIRIVDTYKVSTPSTDIKMPQGAKVGVPLTGLVSLKSGNVTGKSEVSFRLKKPDGAAIDVVERYPILLEGKEHGTNIIIGFMLAADELGFYELEVHWNREYLTSILFRLVVNEPQRSTN